MSLGCKCALVLALLSATTHAQEGKEKLVNVTSFSSRAVNFVATHTARNPGAYVEGTELPIARTGKWSVRKYGVTGCTHEAFACVAVLYTTPDKELVCEWTVQVAAEAKDDLLVDLNEAAARHYMVRLSADEARKLTAGRKQPKFVLPAIARAADLRGTSHVLLTITPEGTVSTVRTLTEIPLLHDAVEDYFRQWHFAPRTIHGRPVSSFAYAHLAFTLAKQNADFDESAPPKSRLK